MAQEIERKFLVTGPYKPLAVKSTRITQGYLSSVPERTVRVRAKGDKGFITVKGIGNKSGASRFEWEKEIPVEDVRSLLELSEPGVEDLLKICEPGVIDKTRYEIKAGKHTFEVDEFYGDNQGLTLAEIELGAEDEAFEKPSWLGAEVTGDTRYYNSMLMKNPFKNWK